MMPWYGPAGMTMHVCEIDFRVGGRYLYGLQSGEGWEYFTSGTYEEIVPLERIVVSEGLSDADGSPVAPAHYGMHGDTSDRMTIIVSFEDIDGRRTRLTLQHLGWADAAMAEQAGGGWNQAFGKLAEALASA